jgi:hypothetical protein
VDERQHRRAAPPKSIASIGTPAGSSHSGAIAGSCAAGVVKRAFGCAAFGLGLGRPVVALPVERVRGRLGGHALPPHVAVVVSAQLVKIVFARIV